MNLVTVCPEACRRQHWDTRGPGRAPAWHSGPGAWGALGWRALGRSVLNKVFPVWPTSGPASEVSVDRPLELWPHSAHGDTAWLSRFNPGNQGRRPKATRRGLGPANDRDRVRACCTGGSTWTPPLLKRAGLGVGGGPPLLTWSRAWGPPCSPALDRGPADRHPTEGAAHGAQTQISVGGPWPLRAQGILAAGPRARSQGP